jgi:hypothetical protein
MGLNRSLSELVLSCVGSGLTTGHIGLSYHHTMEIEQMMAWLLAEKKAEIEPTKPRRMPI